MNVACIRRFVTMAPAALALATLGNAAPLRAQPSVVAAQSPAVRGALVSGKTVWPFTGTDGRDYCLVGAWGGQAVAMIFDITDLAHITKTDSIALDARAISAVTISHGARYAALQLERALPQVVGVVLLDLAIPAHPTVASAFDRPRTGTEPVLRATNERLYASADGEQLVTIDVTDLTQPRYWGSASPVRTRRSNVWVRDAIAYVAFESTFPVQRKLAASNDGELVAAPSVTDVFRVDVGREIYSSSQPSTAQTVLTVRDVATQGGERPWYGTQYHLGAALANRSQDDTGMVVSPASRLHSTALTSHSGATSGEIPRAASLATSGDEIQAYASYDVALTTEGITPTYTANGPRVIDVSGEGAADQVGAPSTIPVIDATERQSRANLARWARSAVEWKGHVLVTDFNANLWALTTQRQPTPNTP
jgi:hypothetical protein